MVTYEIYTYTGTKPGAGTESNVFINLIGTRGDSGRRRLHQSKNNKVKFLRGQVTKVSLYFTHYLYLDFNLKDTLKDIPWDIHLVCTGQQGGVLISRCLLLFWIWVEMWFMQEHYNHQSQSFLLNNSKILKIPLPGGVDQLVTKLAPCWAWLRAFAKIPFNLILKVVRAWVP